MWRICSCCFAWIFLVLSVAIIGISLYVHLDFEEIIDNRVKSEMILNKDHVLYDEWKDSKIEEMVKFYVFEVENPNEILDGLKPKVKEIGPFVFRIERIKEKITFSFDMTLVSYVERKVYYFDEIMSIGSIDENITVINLQFMVLNPMLAQLEQNSNKIGSRVNNSDVNKIFGTFRSNVFVSKTIKEILFNGNTNDLQLDKISQQFQSLAKVGISEPKLLPKNFAIIPNNTENKFEVLTGYKTGLNARILKWNDKSSLSVWTGRSCNLINGTNGFRFSPLIDKNDRLFEFSIDICRSIEMSYEFSYELEKLSIYRFSPIDNVFYSSFHNSKNKCYCLSPKTPEKCNFNGILDLSTCSSGAPLILSNPHFRRASESIAKSVIGLSPEERKHQTFVDVDPISGLMVNKARRYQFNVHMRKCPLDQNIRKYLKEAVIPIVWFEELAQIDDYSKDTIKIFAYLIEYEELIVFALIAFGAVLLILSFCCCCCCGKNKKIDPISSQENSLMETKKAMNEQTLNDSSNISHNYDQIFKGQTPLNRLKENLPKKPLTGKQSSAAPPPPPPPPPPPLINFNSDKVVSEIKELSAIDSRQNLLKDIRIGAKLKKVDTNATNTANGFTQKPMIGPKDVFINSLNYDLKDQMRRKSLDNFETRVGPNSYYRWNNNYTNNQQNNSSLNQRTRFRTPPTPGLKTSNQCNQVIESIDRIDSDYSESSEAEQSESDEPLKHTIRKRSEPIITIAKRNNSFAFDSNKTLKTLPIITDIIHIVSRD